jgi:hypothetical protein
MPTITLRYQQTTEAGFVATVSIANVQTYGEALFDRCAYAAYNCACDALD